MAEWDNADSLFRFVQVRAPDVVRPPTDEKLPRVRTYFPDDPTALHEALTTAFEEGAGNDMITLAGRFVNDEDRAEFDGALFRGTHESIGPWLWSLDDYLIGARDQPAINELETTFVQILASGDFFADNRILWPDFLDALTTLWRDVGDSVIAASIWPLTPPSSQALLMRAIRIINLLNDIVDLGWEPQDKPDEKPATALSDLITTKRVRDTLLDGLVLLPAGLFPLPKSEPALNAQAAEALEVKGKELLRSLMSRAAEQLSKALRSIARARDKQNPHAPKVADAGSFLSEDTRELVSAIGLQDKPLPEAITELDRRASLAPSAPLVSQESSAMAAMRVLYANSNLPNPPLSVRLIDWNVANLTRSPVVGDLLVVQQELLRYEAREIADIQNVLAKERKLDIHQFKELQEQETTITTEHEEDRTHDNQTTDRQELSQEASRQIQTQMSFGAGANVSASYGSVQIAANAQFSYATSSAESNRSASTFSKEVVDRSVQTIKDRRIEQQRSLRRQQLLNRNEHELKNESAANISGIYQWVEKVYEAATFNYGRRMMLDVTVPEPALYLQYAQALKTASKITAEPPPALQITDPGTNLNRDLKAEDIGDLVDVADLAKTFRVRGLKQAPPRLVVAGLKLGEDAQPAADKAADQLPVVFTKSGYLKTPANYMPVWYKATVNLLINFDKNDWIVSDDGKRDKYGKNIRVGDRNGIVHQPAFDSNIAGVNTLTVGPFIDDLTLGTPNEVSHSWSDQQELTGTIPVAETGDPTQAGAIPVTLSILGSPTYVATVSLLCQRTDAAYKAWQLEQYEAVVTAWEAWKQEFETAVRTAQSAAASKTAYPASTNSALADSQIATEIRRLFLQMLEVPWIGAVTGAVIQADFSDPAKPVPTKVDTSLAATLGRHIQFVEHAFEWPQMTYRLYPYYWKPEAVWPDAISLDDANPAFADFLRAGSARVVVSVRPGFEVAVCSHLGVGPVLPWAAGKPPILDTDPYISIAEEIKSSQTSLTKPVRIDTPWIVRLPTTLVKLKDDSVLPIFRQPTPNP